MHLDRNISNDALVRSVSYCKFSYNIFSANPAKSVALTAGLRFRSSAYWKSFVYIQTKADLPIGIYSQTKEDIERMISNFGYAWEEYGLFEDKPITRSCYDDGAAVIDGKVVDTFGAELRARYLSKYNLLVLLR
jgi:hypothetical protein